MGKLWETIKKLTTYKSALLGIGIIMSLIIISIYTIVAIPYGEATQLWKSGEAQWLDNPRNAKPSWVNYFLSKKLPETIILDTQKGGRGVKKVIVPYIGNVSEIKIELSFNYQYDDFPKEMNIFFTPEYDKLIPHVTIKWIKPSGKEIELKRYGIEKGEAYYISQDEKLGKNLQEDLTEKIGEEPEYDIPPQVALFAVEDNTILRFETAKPLKGKYKMVIDGMCFEKNSTVDAKLVVYGKVYGIAGTDHLRRDLKIALLWGTPIALAFGVVAAVTISILHIIIAAIGVWYGKAVDFVIHRITEIVIILPFLPLLILIAAFYTFSIWVLLLIVIAFSIFGYAVKTYRAMFLQVKEFPYVEAGKAYGSSNFRIIFRYLIPKVLPTVIPYLVLSIPSFVFLEAALALLGFGDPLAPTWGKILHDAFVTGALYKGYYYWVLEPSVLLTLTSLGFALLGFTLDRIFNPRLKEM